MFIRAGLQLLTYLSEHWSETLVTRQLRAALTSPTSKMQRELELLWVQATPPAQSLSSLLSTALEMCHRSLESRPLWFALLDKSLEAMAALKALRAQAKRARGPLEERVLELAQEVATVTSHRVLQEMMNHVEFDGILSRIAASQTGPGAKASSSGGGGSEQAGHWREFSPSIQAMFDAYAYERSIYVTANKLLGSDTFVQVEALSVLRERAFVLQPAACSVCGLALAQSYSLKCLVFGCGHVAHDACAAAQEALCPVCPAAAEIQDAKPPVSSRASRVWPAPAIGIGRERETQTVLPTHYMGRWD